MNYHQFDATGAYAGSRAAQIDPLESRIAGEDMYAGPGANETAVAPPTFGDKQWPVYANGAWTIVADHRGETWWQAHGQPVVITALGDPVQNGLTSTEPAAPPPTQDDLADYAAEKRFAVETGGIVLGGMPIWTDRPTQSMLSRVVQLLDKGILTAPLTIKTPAGALSLSSEQILAIATAVALHVQAAFDREALVATAISGGTITTRQQIDAAAWPSNG